MSMALRLKTAAKSHAILERAFLVAGELVESAIHRGNQRIDTGFHRVTASIAFHLGGYAARAYSILPTHPAIDNLAPIEKVLVDLLRRNLDEMRQSYLSWIRNDQNSDTNIARKLQDDSEFNEDDAIHSILTTSFMRGIALFDHAITTGDADSASKAKSQLANTALAAADMRAVSHWWTSTLASHLIDELWQFSLYVQIPTLPPGADGSNTWQSLRRDYIQRLRAAKRCAVELWPSQCEAAKRAVKEFDDLLVALPTSAGKTRIAELCILRALAAGKRAVYITPLRALSAQVERDLSQTFRPLGFSVTALYGAAGIETVDAKSLKEGKIVVSTPEKLDFALRNDPTIINDVGLVVLDEGHMLGPNEREVRYEALVQRLLLRTDSSIRRIVCLSALFPTPEEMKDLVAWIRQDEPGEPIYSRWRPTRQRFGVLRWARNAARLEVKVEEESPFVPRFVESCVPPAGSRRRKNFPAEKNELTLAAAWKFVEQQKEVLIYCSLRKSVETLGRLAIKCIKQGLLPPLRQTSQQIRDAVAVGTEWLGGDHPAVQCLPYGIALHHGGLPRAYLNEIEKLLRTRDCPLVIASPTLAQGLNLAASVLIVPSIWRNQEVIPASEFANVAGRAGRAFVDLEGLVLHIVHEPTPGKTNWAIKTWEQLVSRARGPRVSSGILLLANNIFEQIASVSNAPFDEVVNYITGHGDAWSYNPILSEKDISEEDWERDIASLDSAILALLDPSTVDSELDQSLANVLRGSLFSRQLQEKTAAIQNLIRAFLAARAKKIWSETNLSQRKGYYAAGVGLRAGKFLDSNFSSLLSMLLRIEAGIVAKNVDDTCNAVVEFAELVLQISPFHPPAGLPAHWQGALRAWIKGEPAADVIKTCGDDGVDFLQDAIAYRLPWAMEALRVHALALGDLKAVGIQGLAALAVECGSIDRSVMTLLRNGLSSREAAINAVSSTSAAFFDTIEMLVWLMSDDVRNKAANDDWPTKQSRHAWKEFYGGETRDRYQEWTRRSIQVPVDWAGGLPEVGSAVVVVPEQKAQALIFTPDFLPLGKLAFKEEPIWVQLVEAHVSADPKFITIEFFGNVDSFAPKFA